MGKPLRHVSKTRGSRALTVGAEASGRCSSSVTPPGGWGETPRPGFPSSCTRRTRRQASFIPFAFPPSHGRHSCPGRYHRPINVEESGGPIGMATEPPVIARGQAGERARLWVPRGDRRISRGCRPPRMLAPPRRGARPLLSAIDTSAPSCPRRRVLRVARAAQRAAVPRFKAN